MANPRLDDHRRVDQRFGPFDEEAVRRRRHRRAARAGPHRRTRRRRGYIDVNVGPRSPEFMADLVRKIQQVTAKPLSIDTPDPEIARAGLEAYDPARAGGQEADPQFDHGPAGRHVRSVRVPALPADPAGLRAGRRAARGPATRPRRPTPRPSTSWPLPGKPAAASPTTTASSTPASPRIGSDVRGEPPRG